MSNESERTALDRLSRRISDLEQVVATATTPRDREVDETTGQAIRDAMWKCRKCSCLLAFYDIGEDILRIRYKEHIQYLKLGEGGWVQIVCKSCGEPNVQDYQTKEQVEEARQDAAKGAPRKLGRAASAAG